MMSAVEESPDLSRLPLPGQVLAYVKDENALEALFQLSHWPGLS